MTVGGIAFPEFKEPVVKQAPTLGEFLKYHAVKLPSDDKTTTQFYTFVKRIQPENPGDNVVYKLADKKHLEHKLFKHALAGFSKDQVDMFKDAAAKLENKGGKLGELGKSLTDALKDDSADSVGSEGDAGEGTVGIKDDKPILPKSFEKVHGDSVETEGDASEGTVGVVDDMPTQPKDVEEGKGEKKASFQESDLRAELEEAEYEPMLFEIDSQGNAVAFLESQDGLTPEQLQNAELRFKFESGQKPVTIVTRNLQIVELDKNSPILAKAFVALLTARSIALKSEPVLVGTTTRPEEARKEKSSPTSDQSIHQKVGTKRGVERQEAKEDKKADKKSGDKETAMRLSQASSSVTEGASKAKRKRLELERERRHERVREDIIKDDIQSSERKRVKITEKSDHDKIIEKAKNSVEGVAPEKEI